MVSALRVEQAALAGVKPHGLPKPYRVPRPGDKPKKRKGFRQMARELTGATHDR